MTKHKESKIPVLPKGAHDLVNRIVQLKHDTMAMGLYKTGHALEAATQAVGYEIADILEGKRPDHLRTERKSQRTEI